ncbi:mannitol dehydrogenase family protein [Lichenicola sp.]|uniref:mannitol dehydrogenase family protein n=1 Tax=Lichenicola sp. TaxID=2804529 RepID=UPI003B00686F
MRDVSAILQFGTSRFLQAHADLFVSEALDRGEAIGTIAVVQTTRNPESAARIAAMASGDGYPVRIRGLQSGQAVDRWVQVRSVRRGLQADDDWDEVRRIFVHEARVILSNTGDRGFDLDPADELPGILEGRVPRSFPAKLAVLLHARWQRRPDAALTLLPCELLSRNGDTLRDLVIDLARQCDLPGEFVAYLRSHCVWVNCLVDRIVSEALSPVGAVAEPYALWAIERQHAMQLPCSHDAIVLTDDLATYERLKLHILNLGHTVLAQLWLDAGARPGMTVLQAMNDPEMRADLENVWTKEVLPVFEASGQGELASDYIGTVRERFLNPFLAHRLEDIAQNQAEKKRRRLQPIVDDAERLGLDLPQSRLRAALQAGPVA